MPGGDRTGPDDLGPRTGRALGYCSGYPVPGYLNRMEASPGDSQETIRRGQARRRRNGQRGRGYVYDFLKELREDLKTIKAQLAEMKLAE